MTSWWQETYPGGPPVKVKGFPRALYNPAAVHHGKEPSVDGDDVIAYKRIVSRGGRWPWQPFDDSYSDAFALGDPSSDVARSGVAGFQRQQKIQDTGWLGEKTFNAMLYARVPTGLPHAGEPLCDAEAVRLINSAYDRFHGKTSGPLKRKAIPSPNYSTRDASKVRLIVLHTTEGARTIEDLGSFFSNPSVDASSHVGIDDGPGTIGEYVQRQNKAWTAANANPYAVQAELCAFAEWTASQWDQHPNMLENAARWVAEEANHFDIPIVKLSASQAQGSGRGVCQHNDLGSWGGGHWDCGGGFPINDVLEMAKGFA